MWKKIISYIEKKSTSKFSQYLLSLIAFVESIFFPIPPDIVLVPIIYFNKNKFLKTVINCTFFSVLGGAVGDLIGFYLFDLVKNFLDLDRAIIESLLSFKRAGACGILSYFSIDAAKFVKNL